MEEKMNFIVKTKTKKTKEMVDETETTYCVYMQDTNEQGIKLVLNSHSQLRFNNGDEVVLKKTNAQRSLK